ncbi:MAG: NAD(P)-dependent oxidoreductase [Clostridia bacterium]|nr:NAD(P)-dependent oxidoreductase [Clostridia bacterium]
MEKLKITVLDSASIGDDIDFSMFEKFGEVEVFRSTTPDEFPERAKDTNIILQNKYKLNKESLIHAPNLRLVCEAATGFDNIDLDYCCKHGIAVTNVPGYSTDCVAQLTLAMALNIIMHLPEYTDFVSSGKYTASGIANRLTPQFHELCGKTWGIVGLGNIGRKVAEIASVFGCKIIACKRNPVSEIECTDIDTLCKRADIISVHTPLNDGTRGIIGKKQLDIMKEGCVLINVARGAVLDERAVADAVISGKLAGFGCDVYSVEPFPIDHPYAKIAALPNVCMTPHIAWGAYETRLRLLGEMAENISAFLSGKKRNRVDK